MTSVLTNDSVAAARRVEHKARELWGDGFMLQVLFANDGDVRVVATHSLDEAVDEYAKSYEELWHISSQHDRDEAVLRATGQMSAAAWDEAEQDDVEDPELVSLTSREE